MISKGFVRKCESVAMFAGWLDAANQHCNYCVAIGKHCKQLAFQPTIFSPNQFSTNIAIYSISPASLLHFWVGRCTRFRHLTRKIGHLMTQMSKNYTSKP
jgi:L-rhamnose isomerase